MHARTILILGAALVATPVGDARAGGDINWGLASEFGRGLGLGVERELDFLGGRESWVAGIGAAGSIGYSSIEGRIYHLVPGLALGYRKYLGGFYLGPSVGLNATVASTRGQVGAVHASALLDVGYRWQLGIWNLRLGLSGGYVLSPDQLERAVGVLTISVGR